MANLAQYMGLTTVPEDEKLQEDDNFSRVSTEGPDVLMPNKIYGRWKEQEELLQAYMDCANPAESPSRRCVLIRGATGTGKTKLAMSLQAKVEEDSGYFVTGKFSQMQQKPHAAFASAFTGYALHVLSRGDETVRSVRNRILKAVGTEGKILTDMIPDLQSLLGEQASLSAELRGGSAVVHRFKYVFRKFIRAISSPQHPVVLVLDDIHWADEASMQLLHSIVADSVSRGFFFVGTYRDDTASVSEALSRELNLLKDQEVEVTDLELGNLSEETIGSMLSDILGCEVEDATSIATVVWSRTEGNIFFVLEYIRAMYEWGLISFDKEQNKWLSDANRVGVDYSSVTDLIRAKVAQLPDPVQQILKIASCFGSELDEEVLARLTGEPVFAHLHTAREKGLLNLHRDRGLWTFSHDGVQEAVYDLIPVAERETFHYRLGRKLWRAYEVDELDVLIFTVVGQLLAGDKLVKEQAEKVAIATMCLRAAERAFKLSSFQTAYDYLMHGIHLLGKTRWRIEYRLCLELYNDAAETAYCTAQFDQVERLVHEIIDNARVFEDSLRGRGAKIYALGSSGQALAAVKEGIVVLEQLGETFPKNPTSSHTTRELRRLGSKLKGMSDEAILRIPPIQNPTKEAAMQLLNLSFVYAYLACPKLAPLIGTRLVHTTLDHGQSLMSAMGFAVYGMLLCGVGNDIKEGFRFGKLALALQAKSRLKAWRGRVSAAYYGCIHGWRRPVVQSLEPLREAYQTAIEAGDIEFAMWNANLACWNQLDITPLPDLDHEAEVYSERMKFYGQDLLLTALRPFRQMIRNLMGDVPNPVNLSGSVITETELEHVKRLTPHVYAWAEFHKTLLAFMFGDYAKAEAASLQCRHLVAHPFGGVDNASVLFFDLLTAIVLARVHNNKRRRIKDITGGIARLRRWASHSPDNFLGKQFFLEAELAAMMGDDDLVYSKYKCAIALSREAGFLMLTALACERTCKYLLQREGEEDPRPFYDEALSLYETWGGTAKVAHLKSELKGYV